MRFTLDILPEALTDIFAAAAWYEQQREGLGAEFALAVNKEIDALKDQALAFRVRYRRRNTRWTYPHRFPYRICYYIEDQCVHIFAVVHAARRDREWRKRL